MEPEPTSPVVPIESQESVAPVAGPKWPWKLIAIVLLFSVGVIGVLMGRHLVYLKEKSIISTPVITQSQEIDQTNSWEIYSDPKFNYSFKYPEYFYIYETYEPGFINISDTKLPLEFESIVNMVIITFYNNPKGLSVGDYIQTVYGQDILINSSKENVVINGVEGEKLLNSPGGAGGYYIETYLPFGNKIFLVSLETINQNSDFINTYNQILSTFKFINPTPTCVPRPECLDEIPVMCLVVETPDMCPRSN